MEKRPLLKIVMVIMMVVFLSASSYDLKARGKEKVDASRVIPELIKRTYSVQIRNPYAFAAATAGLIIYNIADPSHPKIIGSAYLSESAVSVTLKENYAFVCAGPAGLWIIDTSNPSSPEEVSRYDSRGACLACTLHGDRCFVADGSFGLLVLDISDPENPKKIMTYDISDIRDYYRDVLIEKDILYAAVGFNGVKIFQLEGNDVSLISTIETPGEARAIALSRGQLFVADGPEGLRIYDVSHQQSPEELSSLPSKDFTRGLAVQGRYAYLADGRGGLRIIDISRITSLREKGSVRTPYSANHVAVSGRYAYVAADASGLAIYDISKPSSPLQIGKGKEQK